MKTTAVVIALATLFAVPATANETIRVWERKLKVDPGVYTVNELYQIQEAGSNAAVRKELINRKKAAFQRALAGALSTSGTVVTTGVAAE